MIEVQWTKIPIVGMPGFPTCGARTTKDGRTLDAWGDPIPLERRPRLCGGETVWMLGGEYLCAKHFREVAEMAGDTAEAIEAAWLERHTPDA